MKLKLIKGPRPSQKDMVCQTSKGTYFVELGGILEVPDNEGHEIMAKWGNCFTAVSETSPGKSVKKYSDKSLTNEKTEKSL